MANAFVSYAHADQARVAPLIARLEAEGLAFWWDKHLPLGQNWDDQLEQAMVQAPVVLVVWSAAAKASNEVKDEAFFARKLGKALPARLEAVDLPFRLDRIQRVDLLTDPVSQCADWPTLVRTLRDSRGMGLVDEPGATAGSGARDARPGADAKATWLTPLLLVAGLALAGLGQAFWGGQSLLPVMAGGVLCGGGLMHAVTAAVGSRG